MTDIRDYVPAFHEHHCRPGAAASIDADEFELICHSHSHSPILDAANLYLAGDAKKVIYPIKKRYKGIFSIDDAIFPFFPSPFSIFFPCTTTLKFNYSGVRLRRAGSPATSRSRTLKTSSVDPCRRRLTSPTPRKR